MHPTQSLQFLQNINTEQSLEESSPPQAKVKLSIIIVGAGIGGLASAIALARQGHTVKVLEQAPALAEVSMSRSALHHPRY